MSATRWALIVIAVVLVILLVSFARGDEAERSVEALILGIAMMTGSREA